jgi:capsular polysaccharide transport system permease protein
MAERSSLAIVYSVWRALFLREALHRFFSTRSAWVWLFLEPVFHIGFLMFIFTAIRMRVVVGIDTAVWVMVGLLSFFMFRRSAMRAMTAVEANRGLFAYRQLMPVDAVLVRAALEGFLMLLVSFVLMAGGAIYGLQLVPLDPVLVLGAVFGLWVLGVGFALVTSVVTQLVPETGEVIGMLMIPLYFISGVIFPLSRVPQPYQDWLLLNPIAHGLEAARLGFAPHYQAISSLSIGYLYGFALALVFLGLALQLRYALRMRAQ